MPASSWEAESDKAKKVIKFLQEEMGVKKIRFPKPPASASSLCHARALSVGAQGHPVRHRQRQAQRDHRPQGQHHEVHRRRLPWTGPYALAQKEFGAELIDGGPVVQVQEPEDGQGHCRQDSIADAFLQQICCARPSTA